MLRASTVSVLLALIGLGVVASTSRAQLVPVEDVPSAAEPPIAMPGAAVSDADMAALRAIAGPRARLRLSEDGHVRVVSGAHIAPWSGDPVRDAHVFIERFGDALGVPQGAELVPVRRARAHGLTIIRLGRVEAGRQVIGAEVLVRFLPDGHADLIIATPGPARLEPIAPGRAAVLEPDARRRAEQAVRVLGWPTQVSERGHAVALPAAGVLLPAWEVVVRGGAATHAMRVYVDARDGSIIAAHPLAYDALGRIYETNPVSTMGMTSDVELTDLTSAQFLTGQYFRVASCNAMAGGCAPRQFAEADASGDFLTDPDPTSYVDGFAEVNAYHHLSIAAAHFRSAHGFTWTCAGSSVMRVFVNYSESPMTAYDNAAYMPGGGGGGDCGSLIFGQGASADFAYDGDVVVHEFGHAVTDAVSTLQPFASDVYGVYYDPLSINEGTSDYYAATIQGDPRIAESFAGLGVIGGGTGSLRVLDTPLACPNDLFGEGHFDGRIWGGAGWDVRVAIGAEKADALMFTTISSLTGTVDLGEAAEAMLATAESLATMGSFTASDVSAVRAALEGRGLMGCARYVPLDDGHTHQAWSGSEFLTGNIGRDVAPLQFSIEVPVDATQIRYTVERLTFTGQYRMHFRVGTPVRVSVARINSQAALDPDAGVVVIDRTSPIGVPRCQTLFMAVESTDLRTRGQSVFRITAEVERSGDPRATCPAPAGDAGMPSSDAGGAGPDAGAPSGSTSNCGCRVPAGGSGGAPPAIALVGLCALLARRRRVR